MENNVVPLKTAENSSKDAYEPLFEETEVRTAQKFHLSKLSQSAKWGITAYLFLTCIGFVFAGLMSYNRYDLDHAKTVQYYRGDPAEGDAPLPKPYSHLVGVTHVHSFMLPAVFLPLWLGFHGIFLQGIWKKLFIAGGALSILIYNAAPYLVRYASPRWVFAFSVGGVGLFLFYLLPAALLAKAMWKKVE